MPLERQTVRILARPPADLPDGEYWARLVVEAKGGAIPVTGVADTAAIQVGLELKVRSILGVAYRKGPVRTGVRVAALRTAIEADTLVIRPRLEREGNAAYLGTVRGVLVDSTGAVRAEFSRPMPIGFLVPLEPRFVVGIGGLPAGRYRLRESLTAEREDLPAGTVLPAAVVRDSVEVRLP
jgi:hypothetical protein